VATVAAPQVSALQKERAFFFYMALAVLVTVLAGFGFFFAIGASSIHSPWWVHLHALSMGSWEDFWAVPLLMYLSVVLLVVETPRYRTALDPFIILLAALALTRVRRPASDPRPA